MVEEAAAQLGLTALLDRKPGQLSGGQRQRVALARAIVRRPVAFLMDEPLSNLDAKLRTQTRAELVELQRRLGTTFVYVTHDQVEAMTMAKRVAVMSEGVLQQVGPPTEVYDRAGQPLRGPLHRQPADEHPARHRRRRHGHRGRRARVPSRPPRPPCRQRSWSGSGRSAWRSARPDDAGHPA